MYIPYFGPDQESKKKVVGILAHVWHKNVTIGDASVLHIELDALIPSKTSNRIQINQRSVM